MKGHHPGITGSSELQDGFLRERRVVGKEETEACARGWKDDRVRKSWNKKSPAFLKKPPFFREI